MPRARTLTKCHNALEGVYRLRLYLEEIVAVKKAVELIFNGKILKPEDVQFTNTQNAAFLIKKIGEKVDEKTKNYLMVKIKEPLIKQRDQQKLDIVALKKDVNAARDTIQDLDQA